MYVAEMDTGGISYSGFRFVALGGTEKEALIALTQGFTRHLVQIHGAANEAKAREVWYCEIKGDWHPADEDLTDEGFAEVLSEWYGIDTVSVKKGECARDWDALV